MKDQERYEIQTVYKIHYTTKKPVPIPQIIDSLLNLEKLIKRTSPFVEAAYKGIDVVDVEVYVNSLKAGSLTEEFIVKYVFRNRANYDKAKEVLEQMIEDNSVIKTVVAMGVGALLTSGVILAVGSKQPPTQFQIYDNTIVNIGGQVDLQAKDIKAILDGIKDKKALAKEAVSVVSPAKADPDSTIEISGIESLTMEKEYIREVPEEYKPPTPDEVEEKYIDIRVVIYASDRDKSESNWAGTVNGVVDRRTRFSLAENINPAKLHGKTSINADVTITKRYVPSKKSYEPKLVEITKVYR